MSDKIVLYDIPSKLPGKAWSPNTWKARYSLNYKGLSYRTEWVEYPDIKALGEKLGLTPTMKWIDNNPIHTLPIIYDPSTKTAVIDSANIAAYLDETYPDTPKLFPPGTHSLQLAAVDAHFAKLTPLFPIAIPAANNYLNPPSEKYYRSTREVMFGTKLEDVFQTEKQREDEWAKLRKGYEVIDKWLQASQTKGPYFLGSTICFADFAVAAFLVWVRRIFGEDSSEWNDVKSWSEGRWIEYIKGIDQYDKID